MDSSRQRGVLRGRRWFWKRSAQLFLSQLAVVVGVVGVVAGGHAAFADDGRSPVLASCYPGNEFSNGGSFTARSSGEAEEGTAEIEISTAVLEKKHVQIDWAVAVAVTNISMSGSLSLTLEVGDREITFTPRCIAEAAVNAAESGISSPGIEAEFEGTVRNFPGTREGSRTPAVATITVERDAITNVLKVHAGIELGTTCNENSDEINVSSNDDVPPEGSLIAPDQSSDREAFPAGSSPGNCPGFDD